MRLGLEQHRAHKLATRHPEVLGARSAFTRVFDALCAEPRRATAAEVPRVRVATSRAASFEARPSGDPHVASLMRAPRCASGRCPTPAAAQAATGVGMKFRNAASQRCALSRLVFTYRGAIKVWTPFEMTMAIPSGGRSMTSVELYRAKAFEMAARAKSDYTRAGKAEYERLAVGYWRLAERARRTEMLRARCHLQRLLEHLDDTRADHAWRGNH